MNEKDEALLEAIEWLEVMKRVLALLPQTEGHTEVEETIKHMNISIEKYKKLTKGKQNDNTN